jgi:hypothetical protein
MLAGLSGISSSGGFLGSVAGGIGSVAGGILGLAGAANVSIMATEVSLPGRSLATQPFSMYGTTRKMPYAAIYDDLMITFLCSNSMVERAFFDVWFSYIMNPRRQYMHYYKDYVSTIAVIKLAPDPIYSGVSASLANYAFLEAYPLSIETQNLSYDSDGLLTVTVNFAYRRWTTAIETAVGFFSASPAATDATQAFEQGFKDTVNNDKSVVTDLRKSYDQIKSSLGNSIGQLGDLITKFNPF